MLRWPFVRPCYATEASAHEHDARSESCRLSVAYPGAVAARTSDLTDLRPLSWGKKEWNEMECILIPAWRGYQGAQKNF